MKGKEEKRPGRPRTSGDSAPRYNKESGADRSFGTERRKFSDRDTPSRYKKDENPERNFRTGDRKFSPDRAASRFKKDGDTERRPGAGRFSSSKDNPGYKRDGDFGKGPRAGDRKSSPDRDSSRFRKDGDTHRSPAATRPGGDSEHRRDGGFERASRPGDRKSSPDRDTSRFRKGGDTERRSAPGRFSSSKDNPGYKRDGDFERGPRSEERKFPSERDTPRFKKEEGFRGDRQRFSEEAPRESRGSFKTFARKKDEPFEYGKSAKPQQRPDYSEENLARNIPEKQRKKLISAEKKPADQIRLNRYIANSGLCSRREADEFIESGQITVNGKTITEMGYQVKVTDVVKYGRKILNPEKLVYVLLNKPKDFITTTEDPEGRRTVMDLVAKAGPERIYPVGRLDRATTGLLLFTNDGELAEKLSHPSHEIRKIYQVEIDKPLSKEDFAQLTEGVELEDGFIKPDEVSVITPDQQVIGIQIHSGKNRVVRRIFEHLGYEVTQLDRTTYAGLTKKDLPRGNWRFLTEKEVIRLKYMI